MPEPRLLPTRSPQGATAAVLVLHGGAARRESMMVSPTQLSVLRMIPVANRLARAGRDQLAVYRLLNSSRGWDAHRTPVEDVGWALRRVAALSPGLPVALVGHSLGGRAALLAGSEPAVRAVVALNPWVLPDDPVDLSGRQVLLVHGDADRIARPDRSRAVAERLRRRGVEVGFVTVPGGRHAMLRHGSLFERTAADFVSATLLGDRRRAGSAVSRVLDGEPWVTA